MNIRKIAWACGASAAIVGIGLGVGDEAAFASPAPAHASIATATGAAAGSSTARPATTPPWRAELASSAKPATCSHDYVVDANAVRIHQWPQLNAPTVGLAWYGQGVDVLAFYNDGWAEIRYHGTEEWMRSQFIIDEGLCY